MENKLCRKLKNVINSRKPAHSMISWISVMLEMEFQKLTDSKRFGEKPNKIYKESSVNC